MACGPLLIYFTVVVFILGVQGKHVSKRDVDVRCVENGKFYRNPDRSKRNMWSRSECSTYYLCLDRDVFEFHCSAGLLFDIQRQRCDKPENVHNCDVAQVSPVGPPLLEKAACANSTHIGCSNGECILKTYFCDGTNDCNDGSDELICSIDEDPNGARECNKAACTLPNCFCSKSGKEIPLKLPLDETPQMVGITFGGAVNYENWDIFTKKLFHKNRKNPNSCPIRATFFISHSYTNYRHIQKLWNDGHEIGVNSVTTRGPEFWWTKNATVEDWFDEMVGQANIISAFANVRMEDFKGLRVPYLSLGWNRQYTMMHEFGFVYDSTLIAPYSDTPYWPYTLDYRIPHKCIVPNQDCPTRSYAGLWQMVINPLRHSKHSCPTLKRCSKQLSPEDVYETLMSNFKRHYTTNRAPFGIHLSSRWLKDPNYLASFLRFVDDTLQLKDVYYVTQIQIIDWIRSPTSLSALHKFEPWQCNKREFEKSEIACSKPNTCKLIAKDDEDRYMITCNDCPKRYPWIRNEFGLQ